MVKYENRGQGTLAAILWVVAIFLIIDLLIAILMLTGVNISDMFKPDTTSQNTIVTDNSGITDNINSNINTDNQ